MNNHPLRPFVLIGMLFVSCASVSVPAQAKAEKNQPVVVSNAPEWANKVHFVENGVHYFVGRSSGVRDSGECHEKALRDAVGQVSRYMKVELKSLSKSYEEMLTGEESELVTAASTEKGAQITLREYFSDYFNEPMYESGSIVNNCFVKIAVSSADMDNIRIQAADITGWKMNIAQECGQKDILTALFKSVAGASGWKLSEKQSEEKKGSAFFADTSVTCRDDMISIVTIRDDLISGTTVQTIFASGNDIGQLKKNYFSSSGIYLPVVNFSEYPDVKNGIFDKLDANFLKLYNDALTYEKKGKLFPEKALDSWTVLFNYNGDNSLKTLAEERIKFYKNMASSLKNIIEKNNADLEKLRQILSLQALPVEEIAGHLKAYIETYGAFSGRKTVEGLFDSILPSEKKSQVKSIVFKTDTTLENWKSSCNSGNGRYCYVYSLSDADDARDMKKKACMLSVEKACTELADDSVEANQGESAVYFGEKACHSGEKSWCFKAGSILYSGKYGVKVDVGKSVSILADACEAGVVGGCAYLGFIYEKGESGEKNPPKSKYYYDLACKLGHSDSCNRKGE